MLGLRFPVFELSDPHSMHDQPKYTNKEEHVAQTRIRDRYTETPESSASWYWDPYGCCKRATSQDAFEEHLTKPRGSRGILEAGDTTALGISEICDHNTCSSILDLKKRETGLAVSELSKSIPGP